MLENKLLLVVGFEHNGILIEALDAAGKFYTAHKVNRKEGFILARVVEEGFLYILSELFHKRPLARLRILVLNCRFPPSAKQMDTGMIAQVRFQQGVLFELQDRFFHPISLALQ